MLAILAAHCNLSSISLEIKIFKVKVHQNSLPNSYANPLQPQTGDCRRWKFWRGRWWRHPWIHRAYCQHSFTIIWDCPATCSPSGSFRSSSSGRAFQACSKRGCWWDLWLCGCWDTHPDHKMDDGTYKSWNMCFFGVNEMNATCIYLVSLPGMISRVNVFQTDSQIVAQTFPLLIYRPLR